MRRDGSRLEQAEVMYMYVLPVMMQMRDSFRKGETPYLVLKSSNFRRTNWRKNFAPMLGISSNQIESIKLCDSSWASELSLSCQTWCIPCTAYLVSALFVVSLSHPSPPSLFSHKSRNSVRQFAIGAIVAPSTKGSNHNHQFIPSFAALGIRHL